MSQPSFTPAPPGSYGAPQYRPPVGPPPTYQGPYPPAYPPAYPAAPPQAGRPFVAPPLALQRPAVIAMSATMTVTASLQWICGLSFAWLVATAGASNLSTQGSDGALFHLLHRFHIAMADELALPLYGFPVLAFFGGFLVLAPRPWARWTLTGVGLLALGWSAFWLRENLVWWLAPALYVLVACLILWTPGASRWYRQRGLVDPSRPF